MAKIHPTAIVDRGAELADDVEVGPWAWIGPRVRLGPGCVVEQRALIDGDTVLGTGCRVSNGAVVGTEPQDLKYAGEPTSVRIGDNVTIREFVTVNRASGEGRATVLGSGVFLMAYAHVAHNCTLEDGAIMANAATLAGHIQIGKGAIIGGLVAIHQYVRVGRYAIVGGMSGVRQDVLPFVKVSGHPCKAYGLNYVGLRRKNFSPQRIRDMRRAYRVIFQSGLRLDQAIEKLSQGDLHNDDIQHLVEFMKGTQRGLVR